LIELWKERADIVRRYKEWLPKIAKAVKQVIDGAEVYLFGSIAEGGAVISSDIDIMIVVKDRMGGRKRAEIIAEIEEKAGLPFVHPFEFHVLSEDEFGLWKEVFKPRLVAIVDG